MFSPNKQTNKQQQNNTNKNSKFDLPMKFGQFWIFQWSIIFKLYRHFGMVRNIFEMFVLSFLVDLNLELGSLFFSVDNFIYIITLVNYGIFWNVMYIVETVIFPLGLWRMGDIKYSADIRYALPKHYDVDSLAKRQWCCILMFYLLLDCANIWKHPSGIGHEAHVTSQ